MPLPPPVADMQLLLPAFRVRVYTLCDRLRARGFDPQVWETYRSPARAKLLVALGKSRVRGSGLSMHCYGAAADLISRSRLWGWDEFFFAVRDEAKELGLTWGGDWDYNPKTKQKQIDGPHVQALPLHLQNAFRALPNDGERDKYIRERLPLLPSAVAS